LVLIPGVKSRFWFWFPSFGFFHSRATLLIRIDHTVNIYLYVM
jgi:hypothetical protein